MKQSNNKFIGSGYRNGRYPTYFIISTLLLALVIGYLTWPVEAIHLSNADGSRLVSFPLELNKEFYIDYTHSVMKTTVRDVFEIKNKNTLLLTRTEYSSFGAGLPTESFGSLKLVDGIYINEGINMELSHIPLRVGSIANQRIVFQNGRQIFLMDIVSSSSLVNIRPVRITRLQAYFTEGRIHNEK